MKQPWLSVVMPTYNGARYVQSALESVVAQEVGDFEFIAVDDGSTDGTLDLLRRYCDRLPMMVVERDHAGNWARNTNVGMRLAKGRYLCWLHQDDVWCADRLVQVRRLTCQWPDALLLLHPVWFIDARGWRIGRWRCPLGKTTSCLHPENVVRRLLVQNFVASCAPVFKAEAAREAGLLDEKLWYLADWDLWLKLARLGPTVYHPVPLASFRIHGGSQTSACHNAINDVEFQHRVVIARHLAALTCDKAAVRRIARLRGSLAT